MNNSGHTMLVVVMVMLIISTYTLLLSSVVIESNKVNRTINDRTHALWIAESGIEKTIWCLNQTVGTNCSGTFGDNYIGESGSFGGGTYTTTVVKKGVQKVVTSKGVYQTAGKTIGLTLERIGDTTGFIISNAVFGDEDGINIQGNTTVVGDIFSNGDVDCGQQANVNNGVTVSGIHQVKNCRVDGSVRANTISGNMILQDAYYQTNIGSSVAGEEYPGSADAAPQNFPITSAMVSGWKADAYDGLVYTGDLRVDGSTLIGPMVITGDLRIDSNADVTIVGTVYVLGQIDIRANVAITLDEAYGSQSGVIISDSDIGIRAGSKFSGNTGGGMIFVYSDAISPTAIEVDPGNVQSDDVIFYAPNGTATIDSHALQVSAKSVILKPGSKINYDSKLRNVRVIDSTEDLSWGFVPGTRQEQ